MDVKTLLSQNEEKMDKTIEVLKRDLAAIRTGRASTTLLDRVMVEYYGTPTPVKQVANVSAPEPRLITIVPWERKILGDIERAILKSDLGLNPNNDGTMIRLEIPQLTEDRRKELSKKVSKVAEDSKVVIRISAVMQMKQSRKWKRKRKLQKTKAKKDRRISKN